MNCGCFVCAELYFLRRQLRHDFLRNLFAFLLPMEYLFEDFIFGFIEKEVDGVKATSQASAVHLDEDKTFQLKPDLILETEAQKIIADTKYKIVYSEDEDPKKGISQSDLYQMLSYAVRHKINNVALLYPDTITHFQGDAAGFTIRDEFADQVNVRVTAWQLPVINRGLMDGTAVKGKKLNEVFEETKNLLEDRIHEVLIARTLSSNRTL